MSDDQILMMNILNESEIAEVKVAALKVNEVLQGLFAKTGIKLVDFKIEFGKNNQAEILLADEITPDCCRLWDEKSNEKMDKDRFRRDLGSIRESYEEVLKRLQKVV